MVSKRWLFHGSLKLNATSFRRDRKFKKILNKISLNPTQYNGSKSGPQTSN